MTRRASSAIGPTDGILTPTAWRTVRVREIVAETPYAATLDLTVDGDWPGHRAGQHVDVRLTAEDGYQAERSYSIASAREQPGLRLTVERIHDGEVSPYLVDVARIGDQFEVRGPIGGHFSWQVADGGPLLLIAGGSGLVPPMAMVRHHEALSSDTAAHVLISARSCERVLYRRELGRLGRVALFPYR